MTEETLDDAAADRLDRAVQHHNFHRLTMLSDGIFAIATTLAALEIRLPSDAPSLHALLAESSRSIGAYIVSFFVIGVFWISNRDLFARLRRVDAILTVLTLAMLCAVALIPATAHAVYHTGSDDSPFRFYALVMMVCGALNTAKWAYATARPGLMEPALAARFGWEPVAMSAVMPLLFGLLLAVPADGALWLVPIIVAVILLRRVVLPLWFKRRAVHKE